MIRLFDRHVVRTQKELDGMWKFVREDGAEYMIPVPGCLEQNPELLNYRGKGTFYKKVSVREKTNIRLVLKGVSHTADVYFDDVFLMHHYNAYTGFAGIVRDVEPGLHEIKVCVDNSFGEASALHVPNDYYTYGGIIRPVVFEQIGDVYIKNVHFTPCRAEEGWNGRVEVEIENLGQSGTDAEIRLELAGIRLEERVEIAAQSVFKTTWNLCCGKVMEWSADAPALYFLNMELVKDGKAIDDYIDRIGFREISMEGNRLLLNGKPVFLKRCV